MALRKDAVSKGIFGGRKVLKIKVVNKDRCKGKEVCRTKKV